MICALQTWNPPSASIRQTIALNDHELENQFDCADDENTITTSFFESGNCKAVGSKSQMSLRWAKVGISRGCNGARVVAHWHTSARTVPAHCWVAQVSGAKSGDSAQSTQAKLHRVTGWTNYCRFHQHCVALQCLNKHLRRFNRFGEFPNRSSS